MIYRQQFRTYAESCLRAAECSKSPTQKAHLFATANAFHQLAQDLELRDELTTRQPPDQATRWGRSTKPGRHIAMPGNGCGL